MSDAKENQAFYYSQPGWNALIQVHEQVADVLSDLNERAAGTPQVAIQAARITTLAASLIARHAAQVSSHLDTWNQGDTAGAEAMRALVQTAEAHAAHAAGIEHGQSLDTPRLLIAHVHQLNKQLRRVEPSQDPAPDLGVDDPDDPALDSALATGAAADPELAEASQLMDALSELAGRARRVGHRLSLDVRLHGTVETAQLRGFEMISGIARAAMRRYDNQGRGSEGRRNIAATIFHYAEQRLERMRGTLDDNEQHEFGHYETNPPERYMTALHEETRTVAAELSARNLPPEDRADLQIRFLLAQKEIAAAGPDGDQEWGNQAKFPPNDLVAGMQTDNPVEARLALIDALRRRVENNPFHRDAQFLNKAADRFAQEIAGPPELTDQALEADITADQVRAVAEHMVEQGTVASPLVLSETAELNLTHAQAERALAVLHTLNVVGPPNGLKPRETLTLSRSQLPNQLALIEQRLPNLLELQKGAAELAASPVPDTSTQAEPAPTAETPAAEPRQTQPQTPAAASQPAPAEPTPAPAGPELPRRDRSAERRHPGNVSRRSAPVVETPADQDLAPLLEGHQDRLNEISKTVIDGRETRAADFPAPAEPTPASATSEDEAQHNAQQAQPTVGVGVR
ncbi:hypothetical protein ACFVYG_22610 [Streptomyces sp. NPDC058256]|uniref:hypothetical protein n=1 Tax=Streptomyces sp. NPDC058256 TaxID=3346408 RepID=UPI0036E1EEB7